MEVQVAEVATVTAEVEADRRRRAAFATEAKARARTAADATKNEDKKVVATAVLHRPDRQVAPDRHDEAVAPFHRAHRRRRRPH